MTTTTSTSRAASWFAHHRPTLDKALATIKSREYWSAYPEIPSGKVYGETAAADGKAAFDARLHKTFALDQPGAGGTVGSERSPYGLDLAITYPKADVATLVKAAKAAMTAWAAASVEERTGACLEILKRLNAASFEIANATMHTTGQAFMMSFQAGGPHAQDRALEAVAYAYDAMSDVPPFAIWEKPQGKNPPLRIEKSFRIVPRGVAAVVASSTFPNWNSYPGLFASLVTGNAVIVKPHPAAILPLAITVEIARAALAEAGFDPNLVTLAADELAAPITKELVTNPDVRIVDYTGSSAFGEWIETNARQAIVFTEKAGVNAVVVDSTDDFVGLTRNIAMSLSLYSGQMCTTPQNLFVRRDGIATNEGHKSFDEVLAAITSAVSGLLSAPERAVEVLGAIATDATVKRLQAESAKPGVVLASTRVTHPQFENARVHTPLIARLEASDVERYRGELFGPIAFIVATDSTEQGLTLASEHAASHGALTLVVYSTDPAVVASAQDHAARGGVSLAVNLTGALLVNQSAAFSDFHVTGANPAGNASLTDAAFVASRFRVVQTRNAVA